MKNKIKDLKNKYMNKKGASMMEFFVITLVVLLIGAGIFFIGKTLKRGVESAEDKSTQMEDTMNKNTDDFNDFDTK